MKSLTKYDDILKTDALGRVWTPVARRESLLDEFERSGLSGAKFAALVGVKYQTFVSWVHKRRRRKSSVVVSEDSQSRGELQWLEAVVEPRSDRDGSGALKVTFPGGASMEVTSRSQALLAAEVLRGLGGSGC